MNTSLGDRLRPYIPSVRAGDPGPSFSAERPAPGSNRSQPMDRVPPFAKRTYAQIIARAAGDCGVPLLVDSRGLAGVTRQGHG